MSGSANPAQAVECAFCWTSTETVSLAGEQVAVGVEFTEFGRLICKACKKAGRDRDELEAQAKRAARQRRGRR